MRHLIAAAAMVIAALVITSFAASALQTWATASNVGYYEPSANDVAAKQEPRAHDAALDTHAARQGRARVHAVVGL